MSELYEQDLYLWYERMGTALKNKDTQNLDWDCLVEEIEDMAKNQKRALRSYTKRLIEHILKLKY